MKSKLLITIFVTGVFSFLPVISTAAPDLVNDDTDLFLVDPAVTANRPNVLIVLDSTANWSQSIDGGKAFAVEKAALQTVVSGLNDSFNVGLMMFTETGGANSNVSGTYVRSAIKQMTAANRTGLATLVNSLDETSDKGSNAQYGRGMHEAYLYFAGDSPLAGNGQVKKDASAFTDGTFATYQSPVGDACPKNYIIFISNGGPDSGENNSAETLLTGLGGKLVSDPIILNPNNNAANWGDEYARFLKSTDVSTTHSGTQNIITYALAVYDITKISTNPVAAQIALMKSMAAQGDGRYFAGTDSSSIVSALNEIFQEVQAVNSVFASTSLPVSVNVRGTNLNQVYVGMFRPDANRHPLWPGNVKMYKLALDISTNSIFLADSTGVAAENTTTGFVKNTAISHWTTDSTFWSYRTAAENSAGGASDRPDGELVEKGGAAQRIREVYATSQATRNLYTCTGSCAAGNSLSATPFSTSNAAITSALLGAADSTEATNIINWVRGQDNLDENGNGSTTDIRPSVHGDVLHSKPAVINYNRNNDDDDVYLFYGANDGVFHALKGGLAAGAGNESWGFIPSEHFSNLKRLRDSAPTISSVNKRNYFIDGPVGVFQHDANSDGKFVASDGDKVYLYLTMRRGGRFMYALDVSDPVTPKLLWKIDNTTAGFSELGQTWSEPKIAVIKGNVNPVLIFGAGYDAAAEDADPATADTMGRGIFVMDAFTGSPIWQAGLAPSGAAHNLSVSGMTSSIPSDVTIFDRNEDGFFDRLYVGDTGGNIWRADIDDASAANWAVYKLASISGAAASSKRKFLFPPDVVYSTDPADTFDAVLIGSGDREHPFDTTITNRYYMFKDRRTGLDGSGQTTILESAMFDATSNTIQVGSAADAAAAITALKGASGWYITLNTGEKVVGSSITLAGTTFFNTNQPTAAVLGSCSSNLGTARKYQISYADATATAETDGLTGLTTADRSEIHPGGGYLPSPVPVIVELDGKKYFVVISGTEVQTPAATALDTRYRVYWSIDFDDN